MIDYTDAESVFAYGRVLNPTANEEAVVNTLITAASRYVDNQCSQNFSFTSYTNKMYTPRIDVEGTLILYLPCPVVTSLTSITIRAGNVPLTQPINFLGTGAQYDIIENEFGSKVLVYGFSMVPYRNTILRAYVTWSGGWTALNQIPSDFSKMMTQLVWYNFKQREAPFDRTAIPEMGIITLPGSVPPNVLDTMKKFKWWYQ